MSKSFGETLKNARSAKRITLRKLGEYTGLSVSYLSDIESNRKRPPKLEIVVRIEECLGLNNSSLVNLAAKIRKKVPKEWTNRIMMLPKLSEALLRADQDLSDEEFEDWMSYYDEIKKKRE